jgi:membrane-bound metal-dependent hydrolase YbcI (DUF457 family)
MRPAVALGCLAVVGVSDWIILRRRPRWIVAGLFDHPAHLATAGLVLLGLERRKPAWIAGFLGGSLLPDVDHLPLLLRERQPELDDPRPVSHCLAAVTPVAALALCTRSPRLEGVTAGMLAHFARDLGVGSGVPLLWPASAESLRVPYATYAGGCVALATLAAVRR